MNPFYEHARPADKLYMDWNKIYPKPYRKVQNKPNIT